MKGSFEVADESQPIKDFVEKSGKGIEDIFEIKFDSDPWMHVGIRPGIKVGSWGRKEKSFYISRFVCR